MPAGSSAARTTAGTSWRAVTASIPPCLRPAPSAALTPPVLDYTHSVGCSVTGGFVYRGCALPGLHGTYFYGDLLHRVRAQLHGLPEQRRRKTKHDWTPNSHPAGGQTIDRIDTASARTRAAEPLHLRPQNGEVFKIVAGPEPPTATPTSTPTTIPPTATETADGDVHRDRHRHRDPGRHRDRDASGHRDADPGRHRHPDAGRHRDGDGDRHRGPADGDLYCSAADRYADPSDRYAGADGDGDLHRRRRRPRPSRHRPTPAPPRRRAPIHRPGRRRRPPPRRRPPAPPKPCLGDVDGNGRHRRQRHHHSSPAPCSASPAPGAGIAAADLNRNGMVDPVDAADRRCSRCSTPTAD